MAAVNLQLPPGFRFHPTDEELVMHYLCRRCASQSIAVPIIAEIDLYKYDPWELPGLALYGEKEWYFFSPRDRKYPNGSRPNRAAGSGYWKATGADKPIGQPKTVGIKKALVFYSGKAPRGEKTNWIMHEYRLADVDRSARKKNNSLRLDDWVLCRIYNKKGTIERRQQPSSEPEHDERSDVGGGHEAGHPHAAGERAAADGIRRLHVPRRIGFHPPAAHRLELLRARAFSGGGERAEALRLGEVGAGLPLQLHGRRRRRSWLAPRLAVPGELLDGVDAGGVRSVHEQAVLMCRTGSGVAGRTWHRRLRSESVSVHVRPRSTTRFRTKCGVIVD